MIYRFIFIRLIPGSWLLSDRKILNGLYSWFAAKSYWSE
jgi:hypothetical protein